MVVFKQKFNERVAVSATKHQAKKVLPFMLVFAVILIILGGLSMVFGEDNSDYYSGLYLIFAGIVLPGLFIILLFLIQRSHSKSMPLLSDDTEIVITFDANEVTISQKKGTIYESRTRADYSFLYKVEETKTQYFLFVSKSQMHVIDKSCIIQGTLEELNSYFMSNLVYKYKQKR